GDSGNDTELLDKGMTLLGLAKYDDALFAFDRAIGINSSDYVAWTGKGYVLLQLGNYEGAIAAFDKATKINPGNSDARTGKVNAITSQYMENSEKTRQDHMNEINSTRNDNSPTMAGEFIKYYLQSVGKDTSA
ncbi:MAG: tetratricopeptide repeat protein, partial [Methanobacteriota archaeon]